MPETQDVLSLAGRVAVVTGAGRGIGAATARMLAQAGAHVALVDRNAAGVNQTAEQMALGQTRLLGTLFDGIARHTQEGL